MNLLNRSHKTIPHALVTCLCNVLRIQEPLTGRAINAKAIERHWESDTG